MNKIQELRAKAREKATAIKALLEGDGPDMEQVAGLQSEADALLAQADALEKAEGVIKSVDAPRRPADLPTGADDAPPPEEPQQDAAVKAVYHLRYGEPDTAVKAVLRDIYGEDYDNLRWKKDASFNRWLRDFQNPIIPPEGKMFLWTPETIKLAIREGQDVKAMKTTMVEAQDTLGGYLVPEDYRTMMISRMTGFTVVRPRATIITTSRDRVEIPSSTGGDSQFTGAVRITMVDETPASASTSATNATVGLEVIPVNTAMATIDLSQNLVEDSAFNIATYLAKQIGEAAGIAEDNQFLTGNGNGEPLGILPNSANALSLGTANSGVSDALAWDGLIALQYEIDGQYRQNATWIAEKATYEAIAKMKDGTGQYLWRERFGNNVSEGAPVSQRLQGYQALEQEAMPSIAANAFPLIFGDLGGYYIIDRVGMSLNRYVDGTLAATNQVRYVMRRRYGGKVAESWRFKLQYVHT
jgi:HK97 family phage major capsid protein